MAKEKTAKKTQTKKVSPYNKFMKEELGKVKAANPGIAHKEAQNWATSPDNPKRKNAEAK
ncbi:hypothetical protein BDB00DRAFT_875565 [Zychaea mexicana]|uniref:uncharacterized protein n=1 Tax=Zychaea mexicana TaxID=64656 RepID=UPI0022FE2B61|nr:uncharacterized protein BDB00DRAFT_875565 [Zychaea mexicana]KAI9490248.1 hypothetical protein BDB00DRAFT_875565 [Zychaea mexicana]